MAIEVLMRESIKTDPNAPKLSFGLPVRKTSPIEFNIHFNNLMLPLNTRMSLIYQKAKEEHVIDGELPAEARNKIIERALEVGTEYLMFFDDDVLMPEVTVFRLFGLMIQHPEIACLTGVLPLKVTPTEPMLYTGDGNGAYWDWPLGVLAPIHSAGAGCMMVNMAYVRKLQGPWFNDVVKDTVHGDMVRRHHWGHDRFFHMRLAEEAGGKIYADTGLLLGHWDTNMQKVYIMPPISPCFQQRPLGESWVTYIDKNNMLRWRAIVQSNVHDEEFEGYLSWLAKRPVEQKMELIKSAATTEVSVQSDARPSSLTDWLRRVQGAQPGSGDQPDPGSDEPRPHSEGRDTTYVQRDGYTVADKRRGVPQGPSISSNRAPTHLQVEPVLLGS